MIGNRADVVVIGRGMIGSAAARHLSAAGHDVVLVGPREPTLYSDFEGPFASHFDQGRITRITDKSQTWAAWAKASIGRYASIETQSGITFHHPVGLVTMADYALDSAAVGQTLGAKVQTLTLAELRERCGINNLNPLHHIVWEEAPAGFVNPRMLVEAQALCARLNGATLVEDVVTSVNQNTSSVQVNCRSGKSIQGGQVLVCTGAYGANLVGIDPPLDRVLRTVALAELSPGPELPSMIVGEGIHPHLGYAYWVPPTLFPNGKHLLKIGGSTLPAPIAKSNDELNDWFRSGGSKSEADALFEVIRALLPNRRVTPSGFKPCVVANTPTGLPHIKRVSNTAVVAVGGNGSAAKSSDEIGRLAAEAITTQATPYG